MSTTQMLPVPYGRNWEKTHDLRPPCPLPASQDTGELGGGVNIHPFLYHLPLIPILPSLPLFFLVLSGGRPPLKATSSATVFVNLLDLNDNDPTFQNLPFVAEVLEGTPAGVSVYQVSVTQPALSLWATGGPCVLHAEHFHEGQGCQSRSPQYVSQVAQDSRLW